MSDIINKYPYTDFHAVNLDYILKLVRENAGLHLEESGNQILLKTADNTIVSAITAPYAASAGSANTASSASYASRAGNAATATNATSAGFAATATNATNAAKATKADFATSAGSATSAENATYAKTAGSATNATNAVNAQTAAYAETTGNVEHASASFEAIANQGNEIKFTKGDGTTVLFTPVFATKAQKDDLGNIIKLTYIANVVDDNGTLKFQDATGATIVSLIPSVTQAVTDSYGNTIADYVKSVSVESGSDYVTIDHGTGTAETLQIPYSDKAWKDTNGNVIKNTYVKRLEIITDPNDGHKKLVAYNGDNPEAELFRIPVEAYKAQVADEATHAAAADYAITAGTAAEATHATAADTCNSSCIFIQAYTNHDGSYSSSDPDTVTIESITDANGNSISMNDLTLDNLNNVVLKFHQSVNDPILERYTCSKYYQPNVNAPIFMDFDHVRCKYDSNTSSNKIDYFHVDIGILNGSLASSECYEITGSPMNPPTP